MVVFKINFNLDLGNKLATYVILIQLMLGEYIFDNFNMK